MHRFFLTGRSLASDSIVDLGEIRHQLGRVLRMQPGEAIVLLDGDGCEYVTELREIDGGGAWGKVLLKRAAPGEPLARVTLYQCALKGDRMEWVLQKGTELGVSRFVPVISERTITRPAEKVARKSDRWRTIIREAAEQSRRGRLPELASPLYWADAIADAPSTDDGLRLMPWEEANGQPSLSQILGGQGNAAPPRRQVCLLIGPEGGISHDEMQSALALGWQSASLGPRILRAETAAVAALSILMSGLGEME